MRSLIYILMVFFLSGCSSAKNYFVGDDKGPNAKEVKTYKPLSMPMKYTLPVPKDIVKTKKTDKKS